MGKKDSFDKMIDEMVSEKIENVSLNPEGTDAGPINDEEQVSELFSRCNSNEGFYIKIYRRFPVPKEYGSRPVFLLDLTQPEAIEDLESELLRVGQQMSWPDGLYEAKLFKRGEPGIQAARRIPLQFPKTPISSPGISGVHNNGSSSAFETLSQTAKLIKELQEASGPGTQQGSSVKPEAILAAVTEAYRAGIEASKASSSGNPPPSVLEIMKVMKELAPPQPSHDTLAPILQGIVAPLLAKLTAPAPLPQAQPDFLSIMMKMKELGLFGAKETDPTTKALEILGSLAPILQGMGGGGGGETSALVEVIRVLGPQMGKIVSDVTGTVREAISAKTQIPSTPSVPYTPPRPTQSLPPQVPQQTEQEKEMFKLLAEVKRAILSMDQSYYPKLQELLMSNIDETTYESLMNGTIPIDTIISQLKPYAPEADSPNARQYFNEFVSWAKEREVEGVCKACGETFTYISKEDMNKDPKCSVCGGEVE